MAAAYSKDTNVVLIEPDLHEQFPDSDAVDRALRDYLAFSVSIRYLLGKHRDRCMQGHRRNQLAERTGIPQATLSVIENDRVALGSGWEDRIESAA